MFENNVNRILKESQMAKQKFELTKAQLVYIALVTIGVICGHIFSDKNAYRLGEIVGTGIALIFGPMLIAWIVWLCTKRNELNKNVIFWVIAGLLVLGQFHTNFISDAKTRKKEALQDDLIKELANYKAKQAAAKPEEYFDQAMENVDDAEKRLQKLSKVSSGFEKDVYQVIQGFLAEAKSSSMAFQQAVLAVVAPEIMDGNVLQKSPAEFNKQIKVIKRYQKEIDAHSDFFLNALPRMQKKMLAKANTSKERRLVSQALSGLKAMRQKQVPHFKKLADAHKKLAGSLLNRLQFLQKHKGAWSYKDNTFLFEDDELIEQFQAQCDIDAAARNNIVKFETDLIKATQQHLK